MIMKRFSKRLITIIIVLSLSTMSFIISAVDLEFDVEVGDNSISSAAAIIMDFDTGLVIYEFNADELRVPASMTKMIAVYVVMDAILEGLISLDSRVEISENASRFSYNRAYSNIPMPLENTYTIRELLYAVIVRSASAATVSLGEAIFGSEEILVEKMNEKVRKLGITASFSDSWGGSPENKISARGMADLTRAFIKEYPEVLMFTSQNSITIDDESYRSTNLLLDEYEGVDGFKTGFTNPAGWCFTGTASQEGRRIITVTMGSTQGHRFPDTVILLDYGFENYGNVIANHFRTTINPTGEKPFGNSSLVPISMFNVELIEYIKLRELAIILNES